MKLYSASMPSILGYMGLMLTFAVSLISMVFMSNDTQVFCEWKVFYQLSSSYEINILLDKFSVLFSLTVIFITSSVFLFTTYYMSLEPNKIRFSFMILLFVSSMLLLIFIPNLLTLLIGWDGLGLTSFLLVIYYSNKKSLGAGMITALTNRIGDALLLITIAALISQHWLITNLWSMNMSIIFILVISAFTKSAQIPFSAWLPAAMAAPTPISALVHSSTLVTAGVYLLFRLYPSISMFTPALHFITGVGVLTMTIASLSACMESDLKKIIALSTLSQLGVMMFSLGNGLYLMTFFHLLAHALFKALLFISAGVIINLNSHDQDLRQATAMAAPLTSASLIISNFALCAFPFMAAFYSKDLILETSTYFNLSWVLLLVTAMSTALTTAYSTRFFINSICAPSLMVSSSEDSMPHSFPLWGMSLAATTSGSILNWTLVIPLTPPQLNYWDKLWPLMISAGGVMLVLLVMKNNISFGQSTPNLLIGSSMMFLGPISVNLPPLLNYYLHPVLPTLDQGWQELVGPQGALQMITPASKLITSMQSLTGPSQIMLIFILMLPLYFM